MNLNTIKEIQSKRSDPSVTITLPTYRTSPDNDKDPIRLKNLVSEAIEQLESQFGKRETMDIADAIRRMADEVDHEHNLDGLVIFASAEYSQSFKLPFRLPERVSIEDNFLTRDLVYAMNRSPLYLLVVLSENGTRLFIGRKDYLNEINDYGFPFSLKGSVANANPSQDISHVRDQIVTDSMREVGEAIAAAQKDTPAPVVVVGVDRNIGHFRDGARNSDDVMLYIHSGHHDEDAHQLAKKIWPQIKQALDEERQKIFTELESAKSNHLFVGGLNEVWQAAIDGRVEVLVVEEDLSIPAEVSEDGRQLKLLESAQLAAPSKDNNAYEDIVDEIIEKVLANNGRVRFVNNQSMASVNPDFGMAVITRY
ncbi:hypothetical protein EII19_11055 [Comamonadaceae bacterium OH2310_COT-174]|uniref:AOC03_06830 family ribosome hibernation factor n=1 Tax=Vandammella animalimorsus TaxID=2029117 RepID=UPI000F5FAE81|nr:hypothetical protein EII19_11055 [Comamonadaceae bacterium OH2310_COT-174]